MQGAITYSDDETQNTIAAADWTDGQATATIDLKDDEKVTFSNIPYDVTYTVVEEDYTSDGYSASYNFADSSKTINSSSDSVTITNQKQKDIDTGITTDNLPYIMMFAAVIVIAGITLVSRKRRNNL